MAHVVLGLVFGCGAGEEEGAPVREAADYTAGAQDLEGGCAADPRRGGVLVELGEG